jgi:hypothetical protein
MAVKVGKIVEQAARAVGSGVEEFLHQIEIFATPPGSESEFSKTMTKDYGTNSKIRCTWQFASAVMDYLHLHRSEIRDEGSFANVRRDCMEVLADSGHRLKRYGYFVTDILPTSERVENIAGAYALLRQDTGDGLMRQELLILHHGGGAEKAGRTLGTFITPDIVSRGVWTISEKTLAYFGCGRRRNFSVSMVTLEFALPQDSPDVFGGILCGTSSIEGEPVVLPLIAIKIPETTSKAGLQALCDQPDAQLRIGFADCGIYKKDPPELKAVLDGFALDEKKRFMAARDLIIPLRGLGKPARSFILPGVRKFLQDNLSDR